MSLLLGGSVCTAEGEFVKSATWEATERTNGPMDRVIVPQRWIASPVRDVGDPRFFFMSMPSDLPERAAQFRRPNPTAGWKTDKPNEDGELALAPCTFEHNTHDLYTEVDSTHEEWALVAVGCTDGFRLDVNGREMQYHKWRTGPYYAQEFVTPVLLKPGPNSLSIRIMRRPGKGTFSLNVRPMGRRARFLSFLIQSFPDESARAGRAADEMLALYRMLRYNPGNDAQREEIAAARRLLHPRLETGRASEDLLAAFVELSLRYRFNEPAELAFVERALAAVAKPSPRLLVSLAAYRQYAGSADQVAEVLTALRERAVPDAAWTRALHDVCDDFRLFEDGAAALTGIAGRATGDLKSLTLARAAALWENGGDDTRAVRLYESLQGADRLLQRELYISPLRKVPQVTDRARAVTALLPEPFGLSEFIGVVSNKIASGEARAAAEDFAAKAESLRDMVVPIEPGLSIDSFDYLMRRGRALPPAFVSDVDRLFQERVRDALGALDDPAVLRQSWDALQGRGEVNHAAVQEAYRLLDQGNFVLSKVWFKAAWQAQPNPRTAAGLAFAAAVSGDAGLLQYLRAALTPADRAAEIRVGGAARSLGAFVDSLTVQPAAETESGRDAPVAAYEPGWRLKLALAPHMYASYPRKPPRPFAPLRILPALKGDTLVAFTGTQLEAYRVRTGERLWTLPTTTRVSGGGKGRTPLPVFRPVVQGDAMIVRVPRMVRVMEAPLSDSFWMCAVDLKKGRLLWGRQDASSDPTLSEGMLFFVSLSMERNNDCSMNALALDPLTGRQVWRKPLLTGFERYAPEGILNEVTPPLPTPHGVVFSTAFGVVAMLHPLTGKVLWLRQYLRPPYSEVVLSYHLSPTLYSDGLVLVTPRDSHKIYALDGQTGRVAWETSSARAPYAAGVWKGRLVMVGEAIRLLDVKTGKEVAKRPARLAPYPLADIAGDTLTLYGLESCQAFDLRTLEPAPTPLKLAQGQYYAHPLGPYAAVLDDTGLSLLATIKDRFGTLAPERMFENTMAALKEGRLDAAQLEPPRADAASGISPEDAASYAMLVTRALDKAGQADKAATQARRLLASADGVGPVAWQPNHELRPVVFAHRVLNDGATVGAPLPPSPPPDPLSLPLPLWSRDTELPYTLAPPEDRDLLVLWGAGRAEAVRLRGAGETLWARTFSAPRRTALWAGDAVVFRPDLSADASAMLAVDARTGEELWTAADPGESAPVSDGPTGVLVGYERREVVCLDRRTGRPLWRSALPGGLAPVSFHRVGDRVRVLGKGMRESREGAALPWRLHELDLTAGAVGRALSGEGGGDPLDVQGDWLVTRSANELTVFVYDLAAGKPLWRGVFNQPMTVRRVPRAGGEGALLGVASRDTGRLRQLVDPVTLKEVADAGNDMLYYHEGNAFTFHPDRRTLCKVTTAPAGAGKKPAAKPEKTDADLSDDLASDLGLTATKPRQSDDIAIKLVDWETTFPARTELAWEWRGDALWSLESAGGAVEFQRVSLKTGKPTARRPLAFATSAVREMRWLYGGRFAALRTGGELHVFQSVPEAAGAAFRAERRQVVDAAKGAADRALAARALRMTEDALAGADAACRVGGAPLKLDASSPWTPALGANGEPGAWRGEKDLSATFRVMKADDDLRFVFEVRDDYWEPCGGGTEGDAVVLEIGDYAFEIGMDEAGRAVITRPGANDPNAAPLPIRQTTARMLAESTVRYSFLLDAWRKNLPDAIPDRATGSGLVGFRVAVRDNDGDGMKGRLEWGAGRGHLVVK